MVKLTWEVQGAGQSNMVPPPFFRSGVTNTPRGGVVTCAQARILGIPFRSQRTLGAHPSPLGIGVLRSSWRERIAFVELGPCAVGARHRFLSSSWSVAAPRSPTSHNVNGCVVQGPISMPRPKQPGAGQLNMFGGRQWGLKDV